MVYSIGDIMSTKFVHDDPRMIFDLFLQGQICIPIHLYGENVEKSFSLNVLRVKGSWARGEGGGGTMDQFSQDFCQRVIDDNLFKQFCAIQQDGSHAHIWLKALNNLLLQNLESLEAESWYIPSLFK